MQTEIETRLTAVRDRLRAQGVQTNARTARGLIRALGGWQPLPPAGRGALAVARGRALWLAREKERSRVAGWLDDALEAEEPRWGRKPSSAGKRVRLGQQVERARKMAAAVEAEMFGDLRRQVEASGFRRAEGYQAEHTTRITMVVPDSDYLVGRAEGWTSAERVSGAAWPIRNSVWELRVTARSLAAPQDPNVLLLDAVRVAYGIWRACWVGQGRGCGLKTVYGWIVNDFHSSAKTLASARAEANAAARLAHAKTLAEGNEMDGAARAWVSIEDSLAAGNCRAATAEVARRAWDRIGAAGPCAVRGDIVLSIRNDARARSAVCVAIARR